MLDYPSYKYSLKSSKRDSFNSQSRKHVFYSLESRYPLGTRLTSLLPPYRQADEKLARALCCSSLVCHKEENDGFIYTKAGHIKFTCEASYRQQKSVPLQDFHLAQLVRDRPSVSFMLYLLMCLWESHFGETHFFFFILLLRNKQLLFRGREMVSCSLLIFFSLPSKTQANSSFTSEGLIYTTELFMMSCIVSTEGDGHSVGNFWHI